MPRLPRFFVPGLPLHVIQWGNDRGPILGGRDDVAFLRGCPTRASRDHDVAIHAYVLMTNHLHLLVTPGCAASLPKLMQSVGRVYMQYFYRSTAERGRCGKVDAGRRSSTTTSTCSRARANSSSIRPGARMVSGPGESPWSSIRANACGASDDLVAPHLIYRGLGRSRGERRDAYRELFRSTITESGLCSIRDATQNAWALGNEAFRRKVEASSRRPEQLPMGRPRRKPVAPDKSRV